MTQDKFENWLYQRHFVEAGEGLAGRITAAALSVSREQVTPPFWRMMPKSAYVLAASLVLTVGMGVVFMQQPKVPPTASVEVANISDGQLLADVFDYSDDTELF